MNNYEIDETAWKKGFSDTLLRLMGKRNISINKLAAEILVDPKSIRNYIDKKRVPSAIILKKLADYFEVSTASLIQSQDRFSGQTIAALAVILRDFDVLLTEADRGAVTFRFKENVLAAILEDDIAVYQDMDGNECYGMDAYTVEEIEKRTDNWDNMSQSEQDAWYQEYQKQSQITDSDS